MEDDDDAFLYGDEPAAPPAAVKPSDAANGTPAASSASIDVNNQPATGAKDDNDNQDDEDDEDEEEEDEDSDSDIEFIIDATQDAQQPPARPGFQRPGAPPTRPLPNQSTPQRPQSTLTSEYTPLSRSQLLANASPASTSVAAAGAGAVDLAATLATAATGLQPPGAPPAKPQTALDGTGPEGPPPAVPSTAPRLDLSPGPEDRAYPKPEDIVEEEEAASRDIFDIDLESLPEKPWRRYGADLTDYFNYGFNEELWTLWRSKKDRMTDARKNAANMFGGGNGEMMPNMQQMMSMMPPPQAMQAMMAQSGMPGMPPDQMMAMMASMSGMPPMPGMGNMPPMGPGAGMNNMMMPGLFGGQQSNGGPGSSSHEQQSQQRFSNSPFPTGPSQHRNENRNSPLPPAQAPDEKPNQQRDETSGWDAPPTIKEEDTPGPPGLPPLKPLSESDMSAFLGASGIDPSTAAAAGLLTTAPRLKPNPPKDAPLGPSASKGTSIRGRAAAVAANTSSRGGRAVSPTLPPNVPSGPKNPGKRYNDRDTGTGAADSLDYGATAGAGEEHAHDWDSRERSPDRGSRRSGRSRREGTHDHDVANGDSRGTTSRSKRTEEWDDETASQSSTGGRRRQKSSSSRDHRKDRESSSSHRDRDREREREKEREREARSQARSERRAGRDVAEDVVIPTGPAAGVGKGSRKRSAPDERDGEEETGGKSGSRSKGGSRKKR